MRLSQPWLYIQVSVVAVCCVYCKQEKLLFTTANNIQEIDLDTLVVKELAYQSTESHSIAYDEKERYVYSSRLAENTIVRFPYPNDQAVNFETVVSTNRPYYVAFDSGNSHLYWTELNTLGRVVRCKSDGWIYYSTETSNALLRVTFDGTERQVVINLSSRLIDIQVDFVDQRVYWMEYDTGDLKSVLNNGSDVKTVMSTYVKLYNREIDIGGDYIFYTSYKNILKVHKSSGQMPTVVHTEQVQIDGLLFYKLKGEKYKFRNACWEFLFDDIKSTSRRQGRNEDGSQEGHKYSLHNCGINQTSEMEA
ncbi:LRP5_6 [Mytilus edulis]|uniref:LRP5_6 n=1 Tax=Mytilus edulis TaxID=6550 RepID=A0A8S3T8V3_MYTED|nr:LRP5_6 [Mytilus edulis]